MERETVGDEALLKETLAGPDHLAFPKAELLGNGGVGPEGAAVTVRGEMEEEEERDLFQGQPVEMVPEAVVDPGEVIGD
jgi:hypothetical protein